MTGRRAIWTLVILAFLALYVASNSIELIVEYIWFDAQGYLDRFWKVLRAQLLLGFAGFVFSFVFLFLNLSFALKQVGDPSRYLPSELAMTPLGQMLSPAFMQRTAAIVSGLIALLSGLALSAAWERPVMYFNAATFGFSDPIFQRDAAFYVFTLPLVDMIQSFLWTETFVALLGVGAIYFMRSQAGRGEGGNGVIRLGGFLAAGRWHVALLGALLLVLIAIGLYLDRFGELYRPGGLFTGPGYADIYGTLPMLSLKAATAVVGAGLLVYALVRERYRFLIGLGVLFVAVWVGGNLYSTGLQRLAVSPNELDRERPFLEHHIQATNRGFGLHEVEERPLSETKRLTMEDIEANADTINNVRLWDHEPLLDTFAQIQEIRTYYDFVSVDNDRYMLDGELRQTMLSPRELNVASLPSRTWVNERLTFTHGYGITAGPVNRVDEQGLPVLYVQDLPPKSQHAALEVTEPAIYYGEMPDSYVYVNSRQQEFNYPQGDENVFASYDGEGGVELNSLWRRLLFALYLQDFRLLLSDDVTPESRVMLFRNIFERVQKLAPFLDFDRDPYMVVYEGRLLWIFDAYTSSSRFPYSEVVSGVGNYMRNPVKVVVDAKNGTVDFYRFNAEEPIASTFNSVFDGMFKPISEMPDGLRAHLRHPVDYFSVQAQMYGTYHMRDVNTFYNKEDQWSIPVVGQRRMEPYFLVMELPGEDEAEFILILPFTPRRKDNLAAWMVARSDGDRLGELLVYTFSKQELVFGPRQMASRINQDAQVSQQITLWSRSGSDVIRGTLLVIPIESSLIYVQPLYLRSQEGSIPELRRVVVGYQNRISMGLNLDDALEKLFSDDSGLPPIIGPEGTSELSEAALSAATRAEGAAEGATQQPTGPLQQQARQQYQSLQDAAGRGDWTRFGQQLDALGRTLQQLEQQAGGGQQ